MDNMNFGYTIPYGSIAEIDCDKKTFSILDRDANYEK
jgi:hypothetical protein